MYSTKNIPNNVDTSNIEKIESLNCETINDLYSCLPSCVCNVYDTILKDNADRNKNFLMPTKEMVALAYLNVVLIN